MTFVSTVCHNRCESTTLKVLYKHNIIIIKHINKQITDVVINLRSKDSTIQSTFRMHSYIKRKSLLGKQEIRHL